MHERRGANVIPEMIINLDSSILHIYIRNLLVKTIHVIHIQKPLKAQPLKLTRGVDGKQFGNTYFIYRRETDWQQYAIQRSTEY